LGKTLEALLRLQLIEHQIAEVRRRLRTTQAGVAALEDRAEQLQADQEALRAEQVTRQKNTATVELELKARQEEIDRLRTVLNTTKTNKEYAAILTRINTLKADNSKFEDEGLKLIQAAEEVSGQMAEVDQKIIEVQQSLTEARETSADEVRRLEAMLQELTGKRDRAAGDVPPKALAIFNRIAANRSGDAMAKIQILGDKPPHQYVCGGCNMSIRAEHANALRTRDEVRLCDCCQRILYLEEMIHSEKA